MSTYAKKTHEQQSRSRVASERRGQSQAAAFQLMDNRIEPIQLRQLQEALNNSPRVLQLKAMQELADEYTAKRMLPIQKMPNNTGLPDDLKSGIENLSGYSMDDVKVHYNSDKPAQLNAYAFAQGTDIHIASSQEKYLPHEAWHVVQQKQGRVKPTMQLNKENVNNNESLEKEADAMGKEAIQQKSNEKAAIQTKLFMSNAVVQRQEITLEAAEAAMQERGGEFRHREYEILTPWGNEPEATNCHGYTIHQAVDHWAYGGELLDEIGDEDSVAVFIRNNQIAHSGRYNGDELTHFLIGIGIVRSTLAQDDTAGYDRRYNLPADREALNGFLAEAQAAAEIEEAANERRNLVERILDHARQVEVDVAEGVGISDFDALDGDQARDEFIANNLDEINRVREIVNNEHGGDYEEVQ